MTRSQDKHAAIADYYIGEPMPDRTSAESVWDAMSDLEGDGIDVNNINPYSPDGAVLLAEAVNLAAKTINYGYYGYKPALVQWALSVGAEGGWGDDGAFYLYHPTVGTASFHDPFGEISSNARWVHPWSGVPRQDLAHAVLTCAQTLGWLAFQTSPYATYRRLGYPALAAYRLATTRQNRS